MDRVGSVCWLVGRVGLGEEKVSHLCFTGSGKWGPGSPPRKGAIWETYPGLL